MHSGVAFEVLASTKPCLADDTLEWPIGRFSPGGCRDRHGVSLVFDIALSLYAAMVAVERWLKEEVERQHKPPGLGLSPQNRPAWVQSTGSHKLYAFVMISNIL
jgi:hypothetical protein